MPTGPRPSLRSRLAVAALVAVALPAPAASASLRVATPTGWHASTRPLVNLIEPRPVLTVASFPLAGLPLEVGNCPRAALRRRGRTGALLVVMEHRDRRYLDRFPPRPAAFRLRLTGMGCYGTRGLELLFRDRGRAFYTFVSVGPAAPASAVRRLEQVLDSLRVAPRRRPDGS